jgi:hypothetical protein
MTGAASTSPAKRRNMSASPRPTATEVLVESLESFGESEPETVIVLFTNQAGELKWRTNTDSVTEKLGMLKFMEAALLKIALSDPKGGV